MRLKGAMNRAGMRLAAVVLVLCVLQSASARSARDGIRGDRDRNEDARMGQWDEQAPDTGMGQRDEQPNGHITKTDTGGDQGHSQDPRMGQRAAQSNGLISHTVTDTGGDQGHSQDARMRHEDLTRLTDFTSRRSSALASHQRGLFVRQVSTCSAMRRPLLLQMPHYGCGVRWIRSVRVSVLRTPVLLPRSVV